MTASDSSASLPAERRALMVELLRRHGVVRVADLAAELAVSAITIRRDIAQLAEEGLVHRVRGGAMLRASDGDAGGAGGVGGFGGPRGIADSGGGVAGAGGAAGAAGVTGFGGVPGLRGAAGLGGAAGVRGAVGPGGGEAGEAVAEPGQAGGGRRPAFGMVVPSLDFYWPDVVRGVRAAAAEAGVRITWRGGTYQAAEERRQLAWLVESAQVDGLLVAPTTTGEEGEELVEWLRACAVPVVLIERTATVGPYQEAMESVVSDHALGAAMAVRHLATLGHRRVGVVTTIHSPTAPHVRQGWRQACEELGLPLDGTPDLRTVDQRDIGWPEALRGVLDACLASRTTALLVHSDPEAISLVERCQELGIKVPGDLAVVSYDDEVAELCDPPLSAVRPPKRAVGRAAFELLAARLRGPDPERPAHRVVIVPRLIVRASSG